MCKGEGSDLVYTPSEKDEESPIKSEIVRNQRCRVIRFKHTI